MYAAIYLRRSDDKQSEFSLDAQERQCRMLCEMREWSVHNVYIDDDYSGTNTDRPGFQQLMSDVRNGKIKAVVIHKLDRWMRNVEQLFATVNEFERRGIAFISFSEQIDFNSPMGRAILATLGGFAEVYSRNLATETKKGLREKAEQGYWVGPTPLGYQKTGTDLESSADAVTVKLIFTLYITGRYSYTDIADELSERGYRTLNWQTGERGVFGRESVRTILRNKAYAGYVQCSGVWYPGKHEALISEEIWAKAQELRESRTQKQGRVSIQSNKPATLLNELVYCGACGKRMWAHFSGKEQYRRAYYVCSGHSHRTCEAGFSRARKVEEQALDELRALMLPPEWHDEIIHRAEQMATEKQKRPVINKAEVEDQLRRLGKVFQYGMMKEDEFERERARLSMLLNVAETPVYLPNIRRAAIILANLSKLIDRASVDKRRSLLRLIYSHLWVENHSLIAVTPTKQYFSLVGVLKMGWLKGLDSPMSSKIPILPLWTGHNQIWTPPSQ